jgi:hypothetical protein
VDQPQCGVLSGIGPGSCDGGGGGGSSLAPAGGTTSTAAAGQPAVVQLVWEQASIRPSQTSIAFGNTPQGAMSVQTIQLKNEALSTELLIGGFSIAGSSPAAGTDHPGDFFVASSDCGAPLASDAICDVVVGFAPQGQGTRTARMLVDSNDPAGPAVVSLSGNGTPSAVTGQVGPAGPQGPIGSTGPGGATGATGPQGLPGKNGQIELVTCKSVTSLVRRHGHKVKLTHQQCSARLVSGPVKFVTSGKSSRASVERGGVVYATGRFAPQRHGGLELVLVQRRTLSRGRYVLTLRSQRAGKSTTRRIAMSIG